SRNSARTSLSRSACTWASPAKAPNPSPPRSSADPVKGTSMKITKKHAIAPALVLLLGITAIQAADDVDKATMEVMKSSFRSQGQATMEWLEQAAVQKACSATTPPTAEAAKKLEAEQYATVKWPADGKYLGDWKAGEKLAQSGRGMTWRDKPEAASGG